MRPICYLYTTHLKNKIIWTEGFEPSAIVWKTIDLPLIDAHKIYFFFILIYWYIGKDGIRTHDTIKYINFQN